MLIYFSVFAVVRTQLILSIIFPILPHYCTADTDAPFNQWPFISSRLSYPLPQVNSLSRIYKAQSFSHPAVVCYTWQGMKHHGQIPFHACQCSNTWIGKNQEWVADCLPHFRNICKTLDRLFHYGLLMISKPRWAIIQRIFQEGVITFVKHRIYRILLNY